MELPAGVFGTVPMVALPLLRSRPAAPVLAVSPSVLAATSVSSRCDLSSAEVKSPSSLGWSFPAYGLGASVFAAAAVVQHRRGRPQRWLDAASTRSQRHRSKHCRGGAAAVVSCAAGEADDGMTAEEKAKLNQQRAEAEALQSAREKLSRQFDGEFRVDAASTGAGRSTQVGKSASADDNPFWAKLDDEALAAGGMPRVGSVLIAHPEPFRQLRERILDNAKATGDTNPKPNPAFAPLAAKRTGFPSWSSQMAPDAQRRERAHLPVVLVTKRSAAGIEGLSLGAWSQKLMGDFGEGAAVDFMTRPLYLGGSTEKIEGPALQMLHPYPDCENSVPLTPDGLGICDELGSASAYVNGVGSSLRFKMFIGRVQWSPSEAKELLASSGIWQPALRCSRDFLLREPDSSFEEPLWAQIVEYAGGSFEELAREYGLLATTRPK